MQLTQHLLTLWVVRFEVAQYYNTALLSFKKYIKAEMCNAFVELCTGFVPQTSADLQMKTGR